MVDSSENGGLKISVERWVNRRGSEEQVSWEGLMVIVWWMKLKEMRDMVIVGWGSQW